MRRSVILQLLSTYYHNYVTHLLEAEMRDGYTAMRWPMSRLPQISYLS